MAHLPLSQRISQADEVLGREGLGTAGGADAHHVEGDVERGLAIPPKEQLGQWISAAFDGGQR